MLCRYTVFYRSLNIYINIYIYTYDLSLYIYIYIGLIFLLTCIVAMFGMNIWSRIVALIWTYLASGSQVFSEGAILQIRPVLQPGKITWTISELVEKTLSWVECGRQPPSNERATKVKSFNTDLFDVESCLVAIRLDESLKALKQLLVQLRWARTAHQYLVTK